MPYRYSFNKRQEVKTVRKSYWIRKLLDKATHHGVLRFGWCLKKRMSRKKENEE